MDHLTRIELKLEETGLHIVKREIKKNDKEYETANMFQGQYWDGTEGEKNIHNTRIYKKDLEKAKGIMKMEDLLKMEGMFGYAYALKSRTRYGINALLLKFKEDLACVRGTVENFFDYATDLEDEAERLLKGR